MERINPSKKNPGAKETKARLPESKSVPDRYVERAIIISTLQKTSTLPESLSGLLSIPPKLFMEDRWSFSSSPEISLSSLVSGIFMTRVVPEKMPEYGIHVFARGSNSFCSLIDTKRKVIVIEAVQNVQTDAGSWFAFSSSLSESLKKAELLKKSKEKFRYVLTADSDTTVV